MCCPLGGAETTVRGREGFGCLFDGIWVVLRVVDRLVDGERYGMHNLSFFALSHSKANFPLSLSRFGMIRCGGDQ